VTSSAGAASSREPVVTLSPEQRVRLLRAKLVALVRDHTGHEAEPTEVGTSVGLVADGHAGVLIEDGHPGALAGALLWADRQRATHLTVYVDTGAEQVADFGAPQATVRVRVQQISDTVGRGAAREAIL
jgi:hypothetical protein